MLNEKFIGKTNEMEIAKLFYEFSIDDLNNEQAKKTIYELEKNNEIYKTQIKLLKSELKNKKESNMNKKKFTFEEVELEIMKQFTELSSESLITLSSAEYLFKNETAGKLDYTGVYINYIKTMEIELRRVFYNVDDNVTLGKLITKLNQDPLFKTFAERLEKENVIGIRNKAVHSTPISKHQCGKIRQILLEDGWLKRILHLLKIKTVVNDTQKIHFNGYILKKVGTVIINSISFYKYETIDDIDVLSRHGLICGMYKEDVKLITHQGIDYYLLD